jgi:hypothetical protein
MLTHHGKEQATRLVCTKIQTGLQNVEIDLVELPSAITKQGIYQKFCHDRGYKIESNTFGVHPTLEGCPI